MANLFAVRKDRNSGVESGAPQPVFADENGMLTLDLSAVTAIKLKKGAQARETVTCTLANTDYASGAIPAGTKYIQVYCDSSFRVAVDEATTATIGVDVVGGLPTSFPIDLVTGGTGKVHVQSTTATAVVSICHLAN